MMRSIPGGIPVEVIAPAGGSPVLEEVAMVESSPFHGGEQMVQTRLGVREQIEPWARRVVRPYLPEEHRDFYRRLPFIVVAARDADDRPWATLLAGDRGFISSPHPGTLRIGASPAAGDALDDALSAGADVGVLGIELDSRRRNRVNGRVGARESDAVVLSVQQAFGNCPQYITERTWRSADSAEPRATALRSRRLSAPQRELIERADTFFIASGYRGGDDGDATFGMDASHRGGAPGFVRVDGDRRLVFPDYAGNNHYNTIGNLVMDPRVGLVFVDFESGDLLQLTGRAEIDWGSAEVDEVPGARRLIAIEIEEVVEVSGGLPVRWSTAGESVRTLRLVARQRESADVTSFYFEARDGGPLPQHAAGQYLPIEVAIPGHESAVRTYTLSGAPGASTYRISVKRDPSGAVSRYLHDHLGEGDFLSSRAPRGDFVLHESGTRPVVLVSAGVGVTPMVSMLHELVSSRDPRAVWFVHGARDGDHHPLRREVETLALSPNVRVHVAYSAPRSSDIEGADFDQSGRIDGAMIERLVPELDADFYLCGPRGFMADLQRELESRGVAAENIYSESFGPAA